MSGNGVSLSAVRFLRPGHKVVPAPKPVNGGCRRTVRRGRSSGSGPVSSRAMTVLFLDAAVPADRERWLAAWRAWPDREVAAHPTYVELFTAPGQRAIAAVLDGSDSDGGVLYPFVLRPLAAEVWADDGDDRWDSITPYGYGGPWAWGTGRERSEEFWDAWDAWATGEGRVVSAFIRLALFPEQLLATIRGEVLDRMPNVARSLDLDDDTLWYDYAHKVRKNVKRARKHELHVEVDTTGERMDEFLAIYERTMERRGAADGFYFPRAFFQTIVADLPGNFAFFHVLDGERMVSTELVLVSEDTLYSFLGGTEQDAFPMRPNDLLKHEVIRWGRDHGRKWFVLGGGYGGADGIFKYKLAFAPKGEVTFRIGQRIIDPAACDALMARRREQDPTWEPATDYFPPYRA